ncbi:MAG: hypothetical protein ACRD10_05490, partial [Terriglobia bacterium]
MESATNPVVLEAAAKPSFLRLPVIVEALRPAQWVKTGFVLAPLIFAERLTDQHSVVVACLAALIFCSASSAVYLLN